MLPRIVAIGGGTGLPAVLRGLKRAFFPGYLDPERERERLTAVVTVADDGGSSGRLRAAYGMPAPGDVRNCLLALAGVDSPLEPLFDFRFNGGSEISGHSLGNLILTALSQIESGFPSAVERASELLGLRGRVLPATVGGVRLWARLEDGSVVRGESELRSARRPIRRVGLDPQDAPALPEACEAIERADLVVVGPGSLYTSLIPVLLVRGIAEALAASRGRIAVVMNLMTEPGETDSFSAMDHLRALQLHAPGVAFSDVLVNATRLSKEQLDSYAAEDAQPVLVDASATPDPGCRLTRRDLLAAGPRIRHDPDKLAAALLDLLPAANKTPRLMAARHLSPGPCARGAVRP